MPDKALTDKEVFSRALGALGNQAKLAKFVGVSEGAVSQWKTRGIPPRARRILLTELQLEKVPWMDATFQEKHRATKALQQVVKLFYRTKA
ncbi:MAG: Cro/CI family transcriptional regulator, partial [Elusimicrobia bacterium]|nr:Cro/CI family transcriptional regulator [Elusimicrobiota bacterium]